MICVLFVCVLFDGHGPSHKTSVLLVDVSVWVALHISQLYSQYERFSSGKEIVVTEN